MTVYQKLNSLGPGTWIEIPNSPQVYIKTIKRDEWYLCDVFSGQLHYASELFDMMEKYDETQFFETSPQRIQW